jgi:hypothetical protein
LETGFSYKEEGPLSNFTESSHSGLPVQFLSVLVHQLLRSRFLSKSFACCRRLCYVCRTLGASCTYTGELNNWISIKTRPATFWKIAIQWTHIFFLPFYLNVICFLLFFTSFVYCPSNHAVLDTSPSMDTWGPARLVSRLTWRPYFFSFQPSEKQVSHASFRLALAPLACLMSFSFPMLITQGRITGRGLRTGRLKHFERVVGIRSWCQFIHLNYLFWKQ